MSILIYLTNTMSRLCNLEFTCTLYLILGKALDLQRVVDSTDSKNSNI